MTQRSIEFIDGEILKDGTDTTGTEYEALVIAAQLWTETPQGAQAYFSETALDPYEVANAQ